VSKSKAKGTLFETALVNLLDSYDGIRACRCGAIIGHDGDIEFDVIRHEQTWGPPSPDEIITYGPYYVECKRRAGAWKEIYSWLRNNDFLALRSDREKTLVVMDWEHFIRLLHSKLPQPVRGESNESDSKD